MKKRRSGHSDFYDILESPLGTLYLMFTTSALIGISFQKPKGIVFKKAEAASVVKKELNEYFKKGRRKFTCKTAFVTGTVFERNVWNLLKEIPYGETRTYKWMAERIGKQQAFRAVGKALSRNPIPIIFPCHRIIESDGSIGGYSSGKDFKRRLLDIEYYTKMSNS